MARINVTVPDEQKEWVDARPHLNASGLLQKAIQDQQRKEEQSTQGDPSRHWWENLSDDSRWECSCGESFGSREEFNTHREKENHEQHGFSVKGQ